MRSSPYNIQDARDKTFNYQYTLFKPIRGILFLSALPCQIKCQHKKLKRHVVIVGIYAEDRDLEIANFQNAARYFVQKVWVELKVYGGNVYSVSKRIHASRDTRKLRLKKNKHAKRPSQRWHALVLLRLNKIFNQDQKSNMRNDRWLCVDLWSVCLSISGHLHI